MTPQQRQQLETNVLRLADDYKRITDQLGRVHDGNVSVSVGGATLPDTYQQALNAGLVEAVETLLLVDLAITDMALKAGRMALSTDRGEVSGEAKLGGAFTVIDEAVDLTPENWGAAARPTVKQAACGCGSWRGDAGETA